MLKVDAPEHSDVPRTVWILRVIIYGCFLIPTIDLPCSSFRKTLRS